MNEEDFLKILFLTNGPLRADQVWNEVRIWGLQSGRAIGQSSLSLWK